MTEKKHSHHHLHRAAENDDAHHGHVPYWKRAHRDWRFVVAVILMLAAIAVYVLSDDLSLWPRSRPQPPLLEDAGR